MGTEQEAIPKHGKGQPGEPKPARIEYFSAFFLLVALAFLPNAPESESLHALAIVFLSIVLEAIPFMLVGSLVGGFIEAFVSRERMTILLSQKGWLTVCMAAGAGIIFPVCECAVVPVVRRLVGKGLPLSAAIAYLLGGPIVNPVVGASTALAYALDWRIVILRLSLGYGIAFVIGLLMGRLFASAEAIRDNGAEFDKEATLSHCLHEPVEQVADVGCQAIPQCFSIISCHTGAVSICGCGCAPTSPTDWIEKAGAAFTHALDDFLAVGHFFIIGAFIAALAQTYIDRSSFLSLTAAPMMAVFLMMALAILLNLCSEADAFIAASFRGLMPVHAQMAFMLTGPMFDLKLLFMYQSIFRRRAIIVLAALILTVNMMIGVCLGLFNGVFR